MEVKFEFDYSQLKKKFVSSFAERAKKYGLMKKGDEFHRPTPFGLAGMRLGISRNLNCIDIAPAIFVRISELEKLREEFYTSILHRKFDSKFSVAGNIGNIRNNVYRKWQIYNDTDIEPSVNEIVAMFETVGIPYIEKFTEPSQMISGLLDRTSNGNLSPLAGERAKLVIFLTYILNRRDLFVQHSRPLEEMLRNHPNGGVKEFILVRDWIDEKFQSPDSNGE